MKELKKEEMKVTTWNVFIDQEKEKNYFKELENFLAEQQNAGKIVYPKSNDIFNAFHSSAFEDIKVCCVGQDPYFLPGLAHGLSFSVNKGVKIPRSLANIYKELESNFKDFIPPEHGYLQSWADQGVFLLNTVLTVEHDNAGSHRKKGWELFTKAALEKINFELDNVVFLAWGKDAHKVCEIIDTNKHKVIKTSHPSPLGARKNGKDFVSFLGSNCFQQANTYLLENNKPQINWKL
jgi:uracil-DNA glycosylase